MLSHSHIHRPALERYARTKFKTLQEVVIKEADDQNSFSISHGGVKLKLNLRDSPEVFEHMVYIDYIGQPWFNRAGCGKESRAYAQNHDHKCLISAEVETRKDSFRKFGSFPNNQAVIDYIGECNEKHLYESIRPGVPCMLFTDHDHAGGITDLRKHQEGVLEVQQVLFKLLDLPIQVPIILTSHRTKTVGDYLSTHLRFPTVSLESCNETLKAIHHLLKHTGRDFGGLDFGTHSAYQQLRIPGCSKAGSKARLLPSDGSTLGKIGPLLVGNSELRETHITTEMVLKVLKDKFGCSNNCGLKKEKVVIPFAEVAHVTMQIHTLYKHKTGKDPSSINYQHGSLWSLDHADTCIHSETHRSNNMYITVHNRSVYCQCLGRCRDERKPVLLGFLHTKLSTESYPWEQSPRSCFQGIQAVDIMSRIEPGVAPVDLARHLACIGDFRGLLSAYVGCETNDVWTQATMVLAGEDTLDTPEQSLMELEKYIQNISKKRKRRQEPKKKLNYVFDFDRFQREHPHPLAINLHTVSSQVVNSRFLIYEELNLTHRVLLLHSEMMTGKTSNVIVKMLNALPSQARVVALTPKRLFAESLRGVLKGFGFEFAHYQDENFFKNRPNRVIIEVESLWKLKQYNFQPYDFLLIDESETTLTQMLCTETHKHNIKNNWDVLLWLLANANKVLLADARMSIISMGFVQDHCSTQDIHYIRNTYQIPMQVNLFIQRKKMEKTLMESVSRGEKLYTFSGGRNNAYHLHALTEGVFGKDQSVVYSSINSSTKQVKTDLGNVNILWRSKCAIHTTPSVTIGTSFDIPNVISNIFLFPFTMTAGPKDVAQASRRIRAPINPVLNITIIGPRKNVPTTCRAIKKLLEGKSEVLLEMEKQRVEKDFDQEQLQLMRKLTAESGEKSTLVKTGIRVIQERNLQLSNYYEEITRVFLDMGHSIQIVRDEAKPDEGIPCGMVPEAKVFEQYEGTAGIMAHYEEHEDALVKKEKEETLSEDEQSLLKMVHYIKNFAPDKWAILSYEYWMDYRYKLAKDKRLQMLLNSTLEEAENVLDREHRHQIAHAEGDQVEEHLGILHSTVVPEFNRVSFHAFSRPLFRLFELLGLSKEQFETDSVMIKANSPDVEECMRECRLLLGPSQWSGKDLPTNPTFQQLLQFLTNMMQVLVDGTLTSTSVKKVTAEGKVEVKDKGTKSGKTTRKKRENIMEYELKFKVFKDAASRPYSALDRIQHLKPLE